MMNNQGWGFIRFLDRLGMTVGKVFSFKFRFASNLLSPLSQRCCQLPRGASRKDFTVKANYALYIMNCKLDKILRHFVSLNDGLFLYA